MSRVIPALFKLPSAERFMDTALSHFLDGFSGLILVPKTTPLESLFQELRYRFVLRNINFVEIDVSAYVETAPITCLCQELDIEWRNSLAPRLLEHLPEACTIPEFLPDVVWLTGIENLSSELVQSWIDAAFTWSGNGKVLRDRGIQLPALCIAIPWRADLRIPRSDIFFKIHYWWGIPSILEMRMLYQETANSVDVVEKWQEFQLPYLCAGDPFILPMLIDSKNLDERELGARLQEIAKERGWSKNYLQSLGMDEYLPSTNTLFNGSVSTAGGTTLHLWGEGVLNWNPECGLSVSSAALQIMGKHIGMRHRLWRGQAELLLPMLDMLRLSVCDYMAAKHGWDWPSIQREPLDPQEAAAVRESHYNCQLGHMENVLSSWPGRQRNYRELASYVREARLIRNELAHNRVVTFLQFHELCSAIEKMSHHWNNGW